MSLTSKNRSCLHEKLVVDIQKMNSQNVQVNSDTIGDFLKLSEVDENELKIERKKIRRRLPKKVVFK